MCTGARSECSSPGSWFKAAITQLSLRFSFLPASCLLASIVEEIQFLPHHSTCCKVVLVHPPKYSLLPRRPREEKT